METWADVPGFEGSYQVSDRGRVRSLDRVIKVDGKRGRFEYVKRGQMLAPQNDAHGYLHVAIGKGNVQKIHRLVLAAFVGPCPVGQEVRHMNGDSRDNRLANLVYGTRLENMADRIRHGGSGRGEKNPGSKLTRTDVLAIRASTDKGVELAERFGVSRATISLIINRKVWAHV